MVPNDVSSPTGRSSSSTSDLRGRLCFFSEAKGSLINRKLLLLSERQSTAAVSRVITHFFLQGFHLWMRHAPSSSLLDDGKVALRAQLRKTSCRTLYQVVRHCNTILLTLYLLGESPSSIVAQRRTQYQTWLKLAPASEGHSWYYSPCESSMQIL